MSYTHFHGNNWKTSLAYNDINNFGEFFYVFSSLKCQTFCGRRENNNRAPRYASWLTAILKVCKTTQLHAGTVELIGCQANLERD